MSTPVFMQIQAAITLQLDEGDPAGNDDVLEALDEALEGIGGIYVTDAATEEESLYNVTEVKLQLA